MDLHPRCAACALRAYYVEKRGYPPVPVFPEVHGGETCALVGEAPGKTEDREGRPFVGESGEVLQDTLDALGLERPSFKILNVVRCRPPQNSLDIIRAWNSKRKYRNPEDVCKEFMWEDLEGIDKVISLGATAATALRGKATSISAFQGSGEIIKGKQVFFAVHPAFVLRNPEYPPVFKDQIRKGMAWFNGELEDVTPKWGVADSVEKWRKFVKLVADAPYISLDIETDGIETDSTDLRCIGIGTKDIVVIVPYKSVDGRPLAAMRNRVLAREVRDWINRNAGRFIGHNAGQFDYLVLLRYGIKLELKADTLLLHLLLGDGLPHRLEFLSGWLTPAIDAWKAAHTAVTAKTDQELYEYNRDDVARTAIVYDELSSRLEKRGSPYLYSQERWLQRLGANMQRLGIRVDLKRAKAMRAELEESAERALATIQSIKPGLNPRSHKQLKILCFDELGLPVVERSKKTQEPSVDMKTVRTWLLSDILTGELDTLFRALIDYRMSTKVISTYLVPVLTGKIVGADGRVHPSYNRLPSTGRYSSSDPNLQNQPWEVRDIYVPEDGHVFIYIDMDQLEFRVIAEEAQEPRVLEIIRQNLDLHNENMTMVYGEEVWEWEGAPEVRGAKPEDGTDFERARGVVKNVLYGWQYGAKLNTIRDQLAKVTRRDDNGRLEFPFAKLPPEQVLAAMNGLARAYPAIPQWWEKQELFFARHGYVEDSFWHRKRYYPGGADRPKVVNPPIQAGGVHIVHEGSMDLLGAEDLIIATRRINQAKHRILKFDFKRKTGVVTQTHDSLVLEVPYEERDEWAEILQTCMSRTRGDMPYTATAKKQIRWGKKLKEEDK